MNDLAAASLYLGIVISILAYLAAWRLKQKLSWTILNPLLVSIVFVVCILQLLHIEYDTYLISADYLSYLLTPATICLAVPLYQQLMLLKKHMAAVLLSILAGVLSSMSSVLLLSYVFDLSDSVFVSLLPKSITTAIGLGVSEELGGIAALTAAIIIVTGVVGSIMADYLCKLFHIYEPMAVGLALGTSSHAIGTVKALELGEVEAAMSSLAIVVSGIMTVLFVSFFAGLL